MSEIKLNRHKLNDLLTGSARLMSKAKLAEELGVARHTISRWINGQSTPGSEWICRIAEILDVDENLLILNENAEKSQDFYEARLRELIANQPEHVKAKILAMVAEELASRDREESGEAEGKKVGK